MMADAESSGKGEEIDSNKSGFKLLVAYSDSDSESVKSGHFLDAKDVGQDKASFYLDKGNPGAHGQSERARRSVSSFESDDPDSDSDSSTDSSSSSDTEDAGHIGNSSTESSVSDDATDAQRKKKDPTSSRSPCKPDKQFGKTKGELGLDELPPIEDLKISVETNSLCTLGLVLSVVDCLVTVQANELVPALNLDTMLFFENGDALGQVFDVFGPVVRPLYTIRFNSNNDIKNKSIHLRMPVFYAPRKEEFTNFVFVDQLKRMKGCDASWKDDNEPPESQIDYSDDEEERRARNKLRGRHGEDDNPNQPSNQESRPQRSKWKSKRGTGCHSATYKRKAHDMDTNGPIESPIVRPPTFNYAPATTTSEVTVGQSNAPQAIEQSLPFNTAVHRPPSSPHGTNSSILFQQPPQYRPFQHFRFRSPENAFSVRSISPLQPSQSSSVWPPLFPPPLPPFLPPPPYPANMQPSFSLVPPGFSPPKLSGENGAPDAGDITHR